MDCRSMSKLVACIGNYGLLIREILPSTVLTYKPSTVHEGL